MSRRTGQNGTIEERNGAWRGRYLIDVPGQMERQKRSVVLGFKKDMTKSEAKRKLKEIIRQEGIDLPNYVIPSTENFAESAEVGTDLRCETEAFLPRFDCVPPDLPAAKVGKEPGGSHHGCGGQ